MNWTVACETQYRRTQAQLRQANDTGNIFATVVFAVAALFSCIWCWRWKRSVSRESMWSLLGWFSGVMCVGCAAGAVSCMCGMYSNELLYQATGDDVRNQRQISLLYESYQRWFAAYLIMYGLQFLCLVVCKLMLLGRLTDTSALGAKGRASGNRFGFLRKVLDKQVLRALFRIISAAVLLCSAFSTVAFAVAGAYSLKLAAITQQQAFLCDAQGNPTNASVALAPSKVDAASSSNIASAVQSTSEAVALLLISAEYLLLVILSVAAFRHAQVTCFTRSASHVTLFASHARTGTLKPWPRTPSSPSAAASSPCSCPPPSRALSPGRASTAPPTRLQTL